MLLQVIFTAASYTVTVTDANGCTETASIAVTQPAALNVTATTTAPSCGGSNGSATANALGGTPGYKYAWTPVGGTNATASNLSAATYTVTVTDANGCTQTATAVVVASSTLTTSVSSTNILCFGGNNGTATANPNGGTTPYTYLWSPVGQTTQTATGLTAGSYTVTVTDAIGCTATASITLTQPAASITLLTAGFPVTCNSGNDGQATVIPAGGSTPYTYLWSNGITNANADVLLLLVPIPLLLQMPMAVLLLLLQALLSLLLYRLASILIQLRVVILSASTSVTLVLTLLRGILSSIGTGTLAMVVLIPMKTLSTVILARVLIL